jgi:hypothetical protein
VVVHNFYVVRVSVVPDKAHTILIVNPDAVLAFAAVLQSLEPVSRRTAQERKRFGASQKEAGPFPFKHGHSVVDRIAYWLQQKF